MESFKLFRLPWLAQREVVLHLIPRSRYNLYKCSAKTKSRILMLEPNSRTFKLHIDFYGKFVELEGIGKFYVKQVDSNNVVDRNKKFQNQDIPIRDIGESEFHTFWNVGAIRDGMHTIAMHYINLLNLKCFERILFGHDEDGIPNIEWFKNSGVKVENCVVMPLRGTSDAIGELIFSDDLLDKVELNFYCYSLFSTQFQPTRFSGDKIVTLNNFLCSDAPWFKREHLMAMNCKWFCILDCKLTSEDVNAFLKSWRPRTENDERKYTIVLSEECEAFSLSTILEGISDPQDIDRTGAPEKLLVTYYRGGAHISIELTRNNRHLDVSFQ